MKTDTVCRQCDAVSSTLLGFRKLEKQRIISNMNGTHK